MRYSLILVLSLMISACGFHLRGSGVSERYQHVHIQAVNTYSTLYRQLETQLKQAGATLDAQGELIVLDDVTFVSRGIAFDGNADVVENELEATVKLTLSGQDNALIEKRFTASQSYQFESDAVIASNLQAQAIRDQLETALAQQIVRYLRFTQ